MLMGRLPPDGSLSTSRSPDGAFRKTEMESLPALSASRYFAVPLVFVGEDSPAVSARISPLAESSAVPVPMPPVGTASARVRVPSEARLNTVMLFPVGSLVMEKTAPGPSPTPCA